MTSYEIIRDLMTAARSASVDVGAELQAERDAADRQTYVRNSDRVASMHLRTRCMATAAIVAEWALNWVSQGCVLMVEGADSRIFQCVPKAQASDRQEYESPPGLSHLTLVKAVHGFELHRRHAGKVVYASLISPESKLHHCRAEEDADGNALVYKYETASYQGGGEIIRLKEVEALAAKHRLYGTEGKEERFSMEIHENWWSQNYIFHTGLYWSGDKWEYRSQVQYALSPPPNNAYNITIGEVDGLFGGLIGVPDFPPTPTLWPGFDASPTLIGWSGINGWFRGKINLVYKNEGIQGGYGLPPDWQEKFKFFKYSANDSWSVLRGDGYAANPIVWDWPNQAQQVKPAVKSQLKFTYNALGNLSSIKNHLNQDLARYEYHSDNNSLTKVWRHTSSVSSKEQYVYDEPFSGLLLKLVDADGRVIAVNEYDRYNRVKSQWQGENAGLSLSDKVSQAWTYDWLPFESRETLPSKTNPERSTKRFIYDRHSRLVRIVDYDGNVTGFVHDIDDNVVIEYNLDANGQVLAQTSRVYKGNGQLESETRLNAWNAETSLANGEIGLAVQPG